MEIEMKCETLGANNTCEWESSKDAKQIEISKENISIIGLRVLLFFFNLSKTKFQKTFYAKKSKENFESKMILNCYFGLDGSPKAVSYVWEALTESFQDWFFLLRSSKIVSNRWDASLDVERCDVAMFHKHLLCLVLISVLYTLLRGILLKHLFVEMTSSRLSSIVRVAN